jgi:hypothetical protein
VLVASVIVALGCWYYLNKSGKEKIVNDMVKDSDFKF